MRYRKHPLRKDSRTIPLPGDKDRGNGEDHGRWFRCWNCGFICDSQRDATGDGEGTYRTEFTVPATPSQGYPLTSIACLRGLVALEADTDGNNQPVVYNFMPAVGSGCPFCGTLNYKGDRP